MSNVKKKKKKKIVITTKKKNLTNEEMCNFIDKTFNTLIKERII